jgi:hypothetical protein
LKIIFRIIYFTFCTRILLYFQVYGYILYFYFFHFLQVLCLENTQTLPI